MLIHMHISFLLLSSVLVICSCKTVPEHRGNQQIPSLIASLETGGCLGLCPVYQVRIYADRSIHFNGIAHTQVSGKAIDSLSSREWTTLRSAIAESRFSHLDSAYITPIMDASSATIQLFTDGKLHQVTCRGDAPTAFRIMQEHLASILDDRQWVRGAPRKAQESPIEMILELYSADDISALEEQFADQELTMIKRLAPDRLIYLFRTRSDQENSELLLETLRKDDRVKQAQWNRKLKQRK